MERNMYYTVKTRSKKTKAFIEHIMPSMIKQLGLARFNKLVMIDITNDVGDGNDGVTVPLPGLDSYVIAIKPRKWQEMGVTLAHEMVHVKQLAQGTLKAENGVKIWRGKKYRKNTKYLNMPWELEALAKQEIIFRKAID